MVGLIVYQYFYRYNATRKSIEPLINVDNTMAQNKLNTAITEHQSFYNNNKKDFNYGERIMMDHAKRHLDTVIDGNDPAFIDSETGQTKHQSDIVKSSLLRTPKTDYTDT